LNTDRPLFARLRDKARFGIMYKPALLSKVVDGSKTETRRVITKQPPDFGPDCVRVAAVNVPPLESSRLFCYIGFDSKGEARWNSEPFSLRFNEGDLLYVKEPWSISSTHGPNELFLHRPGDNGIRIRAETIGQEQFDKFHGSEDLADGKRKFRSKMFSPRWAARYLLKVDGVRLHQIQEITEAEAIAEGAGTAVFSTDVPGRAGPLLSGICHRAGFACLWDSINKAPVDWTSNPWTAALKFETLAESGCPICYSIQGPEHFNYCMKQEQQLEELLCRSC
jgi:hypothetical protein